MKRKNFAQFIFLIPILALSCSINTTPSPKPSTNQAAPQANMSTSKCDPNYSGCVPIASDVDCAGGGGNGPAYVTGPVAVIGKDIYDLDRDGDGIV
jgi:hypothetical protein